MMFLVILALSCKVQSDWQPLFNDDLSNAMDEKGVWVFNDNILTAAEDACIFTQVEYENFVVDLEFKNEEGSGMGTEHRLEHMVRSGHPGRCIWSCIICIEKL